VFILDANTKTADSENLKTCCANFYENDLVAMVLGDSFHPGGEELTAHLGKKLGISKDHKVLDVACGPGTSAIALAKEFGCSVVGVDLSPKNLDLAQKKAQDMDLDNLIEFKCSDAEKLDFPDETFDFVICECALCTFPDMQTAVSEMHRVLKEGGKVGITDVIIEKDLPEGLNNIVSHVLCIAGAKSKDGYKDILRETIFSDVEFEDHSYTLEEIMKRTKKLIYGWDFLNKISESGLDKIFDITPKEAKELIDLGFSELEKGTFGYGLFSGVK
jgi:ubiquinone/menaquinone biosynthesis C-methylase UbiE